MKRIYCTVLVCCLGLLAPAFAAPPLPQQIDLEHEIGRRTTVRGTARDSKGGAIVVLAQGEVIYIDALEAWPDAVHGKQVTATGLLQRRKYIPDPTVGPDGGIAQGAKGLQFVLTQAQWKVAP